MSVPIAYVGLIMIWATTPLGIQWSNDSLSPITAVLFRILLAWLIIFPICYVMRAGSLDVMKHWRSYLAASIGLFPNMPLVNMAAHYIPSGLIALIFGMSPFIVALFSHYILQEQYMTPRRYVALIISLAGMAVLFNEHLMADSEAVVGIVLMLISIVFFSISAVLVKKYHADIHPLMQVNGALLFALPGLLVCWCVIDGSLPVHMSQRSGFSILYLAGVGSVLGYLVYFYLLKVLAASSVSAVALISPMLSVWIGVGVNHEPLSWGILAGSALVVIGLGLFSGISGVKWHQQAG